MTGSGGTTGAGDRSRPPRPSALRRYGQNHLVDANILRAIVVQAAVTADDVVLEVGAAGGLLTWPLLERAGVVHAYEIDRRWLPRLEERAATEPQFVLHAGDALRDDLAGLDPPPTAVVANLAYNIAIPLIMTTVAELPSVRRWAVMVQRELSERLFAAPSTKAYAAVSVLTQLACRLEASRTVPATAFRPRPRVESSFVSFVRRAADDAPSPEEYRTAARLIRLAFGQRRKMLVNSLGGAVLGGAGDAGTTPSRAGHADGVPDGVGPARATLGRDDVLAALRGVGLSEAARPEELTPPQWRAFAAALLQRADGPAAGGRPALGAAR